MRRDAGYRVSGADHVRRRVALWFALAAMVVTAFGAGPTSFQPDFPSPVDDTALYFDSDAPPGGDGSIAHPFNSLSDVAPASGATWRLRGVFYDQRIEAAGLSHFTLQPWPDATERPVLDNRARLASAAWSAAAPGVYSAQVDTPFGDVSAVLYRYGEAVTPEGHYFGFLERSAAADLATALADLAGSPGRWWCDGAGLIVVSPPPEAGGAAPTDAGENLAYGFVRVAGFPGQMSNILLRDLRACTIEGLELRLGLNARGDAYNVLIDGSVGSVIRDCVGHDSGRHGFGFVGYGANDQNRIENCTATGAWDCDRGWSAFVHYGDTLGVFGARYIGCTAEMLPTLGTDAATARPKDGVLRQAPSGFYAHTSGVSYLRDIEWRRCVAVGFTGFAHAKAFGASNLPYINPALRYSYGAYPARAIECRLENGEIFGDLDPGVAFVRCDFDSPRAKDFLGFAGAGTRVVYRSPPGRYAEYTLMESCEISADFGGAAFGTGEHVSMFAVEQYDPSLGAYQYNFPLDKHQLIMRGVSVYARGAASGIAGSPGWFALTDLVGPAASTARAIDIEQCVFSSNTPFHFVSAYGFSAGFLDVALRARNNWYHNIAPGGFAVSWSAPDAPNAARFDETDEWRRQAFADGDGATWSGGGVYGDDPRYTAPASGDLTPDAGAGLTLKRSVFDYEAGPSTPIDIAAQPYRRAFGAHQPPLPADLNHDGAVNASDLALLLSFWGAGASPADLNGDGRVDSQDLSILLSWFGTRHP